MKTTMLVALAIGAAALAACEKRLDTAHLSSTSAQRAAESSGRLIGTPPAPPTTPAEAPPETTPVPADKQLDAQPKLAETAQTTSSSEASKEITKGEESASSPLPGQANDHSNVASDGSQRAGQVDPQMRSDRNDAGANPPQRQSPAGTQ